MAASHLRPLGVPFDAEVAAAVATAGEGLGRVRGNVALLLHERGGTVDDAVDYAQRWALLPRARAEKLVEFLTDETWRAYMTCYVEGLPLCRAFVAGHLRPLGVPYDADLVASVRQAAESLGYVRGNAALLLHEEGADPDDAVAYLERWSLLPKARAEKAVSFLLDPTWRAYITCYVEGLPLCRRWVAGDAARFERLVTEQLLPSDLN